MNAPQIAFLSHTADSVELKTGVNAAGEPTYATPVSNVACRFEQIARDLREENGDIVAISARFFFDGSLAFVPQSKVTFGGVAFFVVRMVVVWNEDGSAHHYELLCR